MNLLTEVKANCDACTKELVQIKKAVRAIVRSLDSDDPHALAAAIDELDIQQDISAEAVDAALVRIHG